MCNILVVAFCLLGPILDQAISSQILREMLADNVELICRYEQFCVIANLA